MHSRGQLGASFTSLYLRSADPGHLGTDFIYWDPKIGDGSPGLCFQTIPQ